MKIKLNYLIIKSKTSHGAPVAIPNNIYSLTTSLCTLNIGGWNHSDLVFITFLQHLLTRTPSRTCLVMQSLFVCVTLALKLPSSPSWHSFMCLFMKDDSSSSLYLCSVPLVYRFLAVSPMYTALSVSGHSWHSTS